MSRADRRNEVEHSRTGRLAVLAAAVSANLGLVATAGVPVTSLTCLVVVAVGHYVSWRGRSRERTRRGQALLALLMVAGVLYLVADLFGGVFGGALPQAKFALALQAITSFDLKSRRNLFTHVWHSLAILYVDALFAYTISFLPFVVGWGCAVWLFLHWTRVPSVPQRTDAPPPPSDGRRALGARGATWLVGWAIVAGMVFAGLPRFAGRPLAVPLVVSVPVANSSAEAIPAALPLVGTTPSDGSGGINLRARGRFGDEVVMHVRSASESYWRAYSLTQYTHTEWLRGNADRNPTTVPGAVRTLVVHGEPADAHAPVLSQSFFINRPLGSEVIAAYPMRELYFPAERLAVAQDGTVRARSPLGSGTNYTAVSAIRNTSPDVLRNNGAVGPVDAAALDAVRLPSGVPREVLRLAAAVTAGQTTEYDVVQSLVRYLSTHERYALDTPRLGDGNDAVDQFLFRDHVGFCEQFASALAVMLRSRNIPARVAVGYTTGDRDIFTGTYTVRNSDAHAWTEVYFPTVGWVPFDASPGFDPSAHPPSGGGGFLGNMTVSAASLSAPAGATLVVALLTFAVPLLIGMMIAAVARRRGVPAAVVRYRAAQR